MARSLGLVLVLMVPCMAEEGVREYFPVITNASRDFSLAQVGKTTGEVSKEFGKAVITKAGEWVYYQPFHLGGNTEQMRRRFSFAHGCVAGVVTEVRKVGCVSVQATE